MKGTSKKKKVLWRVTKKRSLVLFSTSIYINQIIFIISLEILYILSSGLTTMPNVTATEIHKSPYEQLNKKF